MNGLMGDWACRPVEERGIYAVYQKGDIAALKERDRRLKSEWRGVVRENALLSADNDRLMRENAELREKLERYEWQAKRRESEREAENARQGG